MAAGLVSSGGAMMVMALWMPASPLKVLYVRTWDLLLLLTGGWTRQWRREKTLLAFQSWGWHRS